MNSVLLSLTTLSNRFVLLVGLGILYLGCQVSAAPISFNVTGKYQDNWQYYYDLNGYITFESSLSPFFELKWENFVQNNYPDYYALSFDVISYSFNFGNGNRTYTGNDGYIAFDLDYDSSTNTLLYDADFMALFDMPFNEVLWEASGSYITDNIVSPVFPDLDSASCFTSPEIGIHELYFEEQNLVPESSIVLFLVSGLIFVVLMVLILKRNRRIHLYAKSVFIRHPIPELFGRG